MTELMVDLVLLIAVGAVYIGTAIGLRWALMRHLGEDK